jgi:hypothetical protein
MRPFGQLCSGSWILKGCSIPVIFGNKVNVVEDKAVEVVHLEGLDKADVHEGRTVKIFALNKLLTLIYLT